MLEVFKIIEISQALLLHDNYLDGSFFVLFLCIQTYEPDNIYICLTQFWNLQNICQQLWLSNHTHASISIFIALAQNFPLFHIYFGMFYSILLKVIKYMLTALNFKYIISPLVDLSKIIPCLIKFPVQNLTSCLHNCYRRNYHHCYLASRI